MAVVTLTTEGGRLYAKAVATKQLATEGGRLYATAGLTVVAVDPTKAFWRLWFGPAGAEAKMQVDSLTTLLGSKLPSKTTVALSETQVRGFHGIKYASDVERVYSSTRYGVGTTDGYYLYRVNPSDLSYTYYHAADYMTTADDLCVTGGKVYVVYQELWTNPHHLLIDEFDTSSSPPTLVKTHDLGAGYGYGNSIDTDGTYLYIGTNTETVDGYVVKVTIASDLTISTYKKLWYDYGLGHSLRYDSENNKIFVGRNLTGCLHRLTPSDLTVEQTAIVAGIGLFGDDLALVPGFVYAVSECGASVGQVVKFNKMDLSSYTIISAAPPGCGGVGGIAEEPGGEYVWASYYSGPGQLSRIKVSDDTSQRIWLADNEPLTGVEGYDELLFCDADTLILFGWDDPSTIVKLSNFGSIPPVKTPASGTNYSYWHPIRLFLEEAGDVLSMEAFSDGANSLGTGVDLKGAIANDYAEPTGTPGTTGTQLTIANYGDGSTDLEKAPATVFDWVTGSRKTIDGSTIVAGDVGHFLVLQLSVGTTAVGGATAEEELSFVFTSEAERTKAVTLYGDTDFIRYPDAVAAPAVVPAPTLVLPLTLTPSAVAAPTAIPTPALSFGAISLLPGATVAPALVPDPTLLLTLLPGVVAAPSAIPAPALAFGAITLTPSATAAPAVVPDPTVTRVLSLLPSPVEAPGIIPSITVTCGTKTLEPDAMVAPVSVPSSTIDRPLSLTPAAIVAPAIILTVTLTHALTLLPTPATGVAATPAITLSMGAITKTPDPVAAPIAVPIVSVVFAGTPQIFAPTPVVAPSSVPNPTLVFGIITLMPAPAEASSAVPTVTVGLGTLTLVPSAIVAPVIVPDVAVSCGIASPTNLDAHNPSATTIDLSWIRGVGTTHTMIRRKVGSYPTSHADGDEAYFGTEESHTDDNLVSTTTYYYRAWAFALES